MTAARRLVLAATLLSAHVALAQRDQSGPFGDSLGVVPEIEFVLLRNGQLYVGEVEGASQSVRGWEVTLGGRRYAAHRVTSYSAGGETYGFVHAGDALPLHVIRIHQGRVSLYRELGEEGTGDFFQLGDGPIQAASRANLSAALRGVPAVDRHLHRDRMLGVLGASAVAVGAALVLTGAAIELGEFDGPNGIMLGMAGVGFAVGVNAVVPLARTRARRNAIEAYNRH